MAMVRDSCRTFNPVSSLGSRLRNGEQSVGHRLESGLGKNVEGRRRTQVLAEGDVESH